MDKLFICFNAFLLLFIFVGGGINKIMSFKGTVDLLNGEVGEIGVHQPHTKISYKKKILLYKDIIPVFTFKQNYIS